jgi:alkylation response protein AidB-like acyl-CoA dehydrogenase
MASFTEDYLTPEALELIERARAMAPRLAERARAAEDAGLVQAETIAEMQEAGFFKVLQPKRWGGYEMDPRVFYSVQMALAEGCMATAWIYGVVGVHNWQLPLFPEQAQIDVWGEDPTTLTASTYMPVGKADPVEGGYKFSGRWSWSSGVEHCKWILLGGLLPKKDGSGEIEHCTFLLPRADFEIVPPAAMTLWSLTPLCRPTAPTAPMTTVTPVAQAAPPTPVGCIAYRLPRCFSVPFPRLASAQPMVLWPASVSAQPLLLASTAPRPLRT